MKILITGICGNIGSFLCDKLKGNHEIIGLDMNNNYEECDEYYSCDITEKSQIEEVLKMNSDVNIIIHCAALAHKKGNDLSREKFMKVNYEATKYFIDLSNKYLKLNNFIFISTISVYGERLDKTYYLETDICEPKSPYAVAKKLSEEYMEENCLSSYSILRLAPVYSDKFK
ncbi:MAG: NAD-dependent epimerase/dehydratase family protein, partial [Clostridium sp.]